MSPVAKAATLTCTMPQSVTSQRHHSAPVRAVRDFRTGLTISTEWRWVKSAVVPHTVPSRRIQLVSCRSVWDHSASAIDSWWPRLVGLTCRQDMLQHCRTTAHLTRRAAVDRLMEQFSPHATLTARRLAVPPSTQCSLWRAAMSTCMTGWTQRVVSRVECDDSAMPLTWWCRLSSQKARKCTSTRPPSRSLRTRVDT